MAGGNSKHVEEQSGFRAGHFTIRKKRTLASKRFLNVSVQTPNKMIYDDLGRYSMFITSAV